jgi:predicted amidophosphoribosyltransferase
MNEEIKNIIEATSMGKLEKEAVLNSLLNLHSVSKCCDVCDAPLTKNPKYYDCNNCGEIVQGNDC